MTNDIQTFLKKRHAEVVASINVEKKQSDAAQRQVKRCREQIAHLQARLVEVEHQMRELAVSESDENVIHMNRAKESSKKRSGTKPSQRYRTPGPTSDIVAVAYERYGIEVEDLIVQVQTRYKANELPRQVVMKLIHRMVREQQVRREGSKIYLTPACREAWESSPLFKKVAASA
jgi:hypothetical protein